METAFRLTDFLAIGQKMVGHPFLYSHSVSWNKAQVGLVYFRRDIAVIWKSAVLLQLLQQSGYRIIIFFGGDDDPSAYKMVTK